MLWKERKEEPQRKAIPVAFAERWRHLVVIAGSGKSAGTSPCPPPGSLVASSFLPSPLRSRPRPGPQLCPALGPCSSVPFQLVPNAVRSSSSAPPGDKPRPLASRMPRTRCDSLTPVSPQDTCPLAACGLLVNTAPASSFPLAPVGSSVVIQSLPRGPRCPLFHTVS